MKKTLKIAGILTVVGILVGVALVFTAAPVEAARGGGSGNKQCADICHYDKSSDGQCHVITVDYSSWGKHSRHGDVFLYGPYSCN